MLSIIKSQWLHLCVNSKEFFILVLMVNYLQNTASVSLGLSVPGAMRYLSQYGYLPPSNLKKGRIISEETLRRAITEFQSFAGLNATGFLDKETIIFMLIPRCGVKDRTGTNLADRAKRYALQGSRWRVKNLTYKISKYPKALEKYAVDKEIERAFKVWSDYTDLMFIAKKKGQVHIEIKFEHGEHGDGDPFDGPGGTLAHAYFPVYGGDAHFDDSEQWTINSIRGTNLFQVAAHEFGHSLGLSHSDVRAALMAPFYRGYDPNFILDSDDIGGIQTLYGTRTPEQVVRTEMHRRTTNILPKGEEDLELCSDSAIDTIFNSADSHTYVFKGEYYWKLSSDGIETGYPRSISASWKGLSGNIDAAFTYKNGKTYFFKGAKYWRYVGKQMDGNYPKDISEGFTGIPDNIDAATVWSGNGKIYFYKGTKFWRFDPSKRPPVKSTYPKLISNWLGIPNNLDASLNYHGTTYFFKDRRYYRFNDKTFSVDMSTPTFPRPISYWWFGCRSANNEAVSNAQLPQINTEIKRNFTSYFINLKSIFTSLSYPHKEDIVDNIDDAIFDAVT